MFGNRVDLTAFDADGDSKPDLVILRSDLAHVGTNQYQVIVAHNNGGGFVTTTNQVSCRA